MYEVELQGFRERGEVERLQLKYKWTLGLDMSAEREKISARAGRRALCFEEGIKEGIGRLVLKEC